MISKPAADATLVGEGGAEAQRRFRAGIGLTECILRDAHGRGAARDLRPEAGADPRSRALVYGFARMAIDGHFPRWGVTAGEATAEAILDLFLSGIARRSGHS